MDADSKATWMYSRRPLKNPTAIPKSSVIVNLNYINDLKNYYAFLLKKYLHSASSITKVLHLVLKSSPKHLFLRTRKQAYSCLQINNQFNGAGLIKYHDKRCI